MKVLVCGGRAFNDNLMIDRVLLELHTFKKHFTELIHGGAAGVDRLAGLWAKRHGVPVHVYEADWNSFGRGAGPIRNQRMLDDGKPDLVVAFPGGRGTADMVRRAREAGVEVIDPDSQAWRFFDGR